MPGESQVFLTFRFPAFPLVFTRGKSDCVPPGVSPGFPLVFTRCDEKVGFYYFLGIPPCFPLGEIGFPQGKHQGFTRGKSRMTKKQGRGLTFWRRETWFSPGENLSVAPATFPHVYTWGKPVRQVSAPFPPQGSGLPGPVPRGSQNCKNM